MLAAAALHGCKDDTTDLDVVIHFVDVTIASVNGGSGSVTSVPSGIACPATCKDFFVDGIEVTLSASPASDSEFDEWTGDCTGTGACILTMDRDMAVTAWFLQSSTSTVQVSVVDNAGTPVTPAVALKQEGNGPWSPMDAYEPGRFRIELPEGGDGKLFGAQIRCSPTGSSQIVQSTIEETPRVVITCSEPAPKVNVNYTWSGLDALGTGPSYGVALSGRDGFVASGSGDAAGSSPANDVPAGLGDLALTISNETGNIGAVIIRDYNVNDGAQVDFSFTEADKGGSAPFGAFDLPNGINTGIAWAYLRTPGAQVYSGFSTTGGGYYYTSPFASGTDRYLGYAFGTGSGVYSGHAIVSIDPIPFNFNLPAGLSGVSLLEPAAAPSFVGLDGSPADHRGFTFGVNFTGATNGLGTTAFVSCGWLGSSTSYTLANPIGLDGMQDLVRVAGDQLVYFVESTSANMPLAELLTAPLTAGFPTVPGLSMQIAAIRGSYTVP